MTQQIIERWSKLRNLSLPDAMLELRFLSDILATSKKPSAGTEDHESLSATNIPQIEVIDHETRDENQLSLAI